MNADRTTSTAAAGKTSTTNTTSTGSDGGPHTNTRRSTVNRLSAENVTLAYDQRVIAEQLSVEIPDNSFTVIVGPNACGKSTLLRALSRMLKPNQGRVLLDGQVIQSMPAKKVARTPGCCRSRRSRPTGSPSATSWGAGATRTRGCCASGRPRTSGSCASP